jgi:pimeloyl-ACP methyl ester carboxylesterase
MDDDRRAGPLLLLLHGMGGSGEVWGGLIDLLADHWPGPWAAPDLPGHGRAAPLARYSYGAVAAAVADGLDPHRPVVALGHSLGGAIALTLASGWFGVPVVAAAGIGVKVRWTAEELAGAADVAARPGRIFATREEAADRALKVAGLAGLVPAGSPVVDRLVLEADGGWRAAFDPQALGIGAPDIAGALGLLAAREPSTPVFLAAGERDPMSPEEHLRALVPNPVILPGLGHSAHVEEPKALLPLLARLRTAG